MHHPRIIAHRGASGYEHENSPAAFRRAVDLHADGVELDVHGTRDGQIIVHHDRAIPAMGSIAQLTLAQVRTHALPNGESIPLLADVLRIVGDADVWIEVKHLDAGLDEHLLSLLDGGPAPTRYGVHSFDHRIVYRLDRKRPTLRTGILMTAYALDPANLLRSSGASVLWQEHELIDRELVDRVHDAGDEIIAWTVNEPDDIERMVGLRVDGICGNYPDRILAVLAGPQPHHPDAAAPGGGHRALD